MIKKIANFLREAERQVNNAKFIVGGSVGDCFMYDRLKAISDELIEMAKSLED